MNTMKSDFKKFPSIAKRPILSGGMFGKSPRIARGNPFQGETGQFDFSCVEAWNAGTGRCSSHFGKCDLLV